MTVTVRAAGSDDIDLVLASRLEFLAAVRGPDYEMPVGFADDTRSFIVDQHNAGRLHTWIGEEDGALVGVVSVLLWPRPPQPEDRRTTEAYIINMYVPPQHQRRGIGKLLIDRCLAMADEFGIRKFLLHSTDQGRRLYETSGFDAKLNWMELAVPPPG